MSSVLHAVERAQHRAATSFHEHLKRGIDSLATIAHLAPLVGLVGTILGMIGPFHGYGTERSTILPAIAHELTAALLPTCAGLGIATLSLWGHRYLSSRLERIDHHMDLAGRELIDYLTHCVA